MIALVRASRVSGLCGRINEAKDGSSVPYDFRLFLFLPWRVVSRSSLTLTLTPMHQRVDRNTKERRHVVSRAVFPRGVPIARLARAVLL